MQMIMIISLPRHPRQRNHLQNHHRNRLQNPPDNLVQSYIVPRKRYNQKAAAATTTAIPMIAKIKPAFDFFFSSIISSFSFLCNNSAFAHKVSGTEAPDVFPYSLRDVSIFSLGILQAKEILSKMS